MLKRAKKDKTNIEEDIEYKRILYYQLMRIAYVGTIEQLNRQNVFLFDNAIKMLETLLSSRIRKDNEIMSFLYGNKEKDKIKKVVSGKDFKKITDLGLRGKLSQIDYKDLDKRLRYFELLHLYLKTLVDFMDKEGLLYEDIKKELTLNDDEGDKINDSDLEKIDNKEE